MKKSIFVIVLLIICICLIIFISRQPVLVSTFLPHSTNQAIANPSGQSSLEKIATNAINRIEATAYLAKVKSLILQVNQPIAFYARAIDQNGNPISGVRLQLGLTRVDTEKVLAKFPNMNMGEEQEFLTNVVFSDSNGWFQLKGISGHYLDIGSPAKEGYVWDRPFDLGSLIFEPNGKHNASGKVIEIEDALDPKKGYTFRMWKKETTEKLVKIDYSARVDISGTNWYAIDLFSGQVQDFRRGDFLFWFQTTKDNNGNPARQFRFQFIDGGLMEDTNPYPYIAPENGYVTEWDWRYEPFDHDAKIDSSQWMKKKLYFKGRKGKIFGAFTWHWASGNNVQISGYLNPNGSRNLEPDPDKLITDPAEIQRIDEQTRVK